jgi:hypothetical protein
MAAAHRRGLGWLVGIGLVAASCSLSSLDDLKSNGVDAGSCERGVQCSGCATCASFCDCIVASDVVQCIWNCQGSGGAGGTTAADSSSDSAGGSGLGGGGLGGGGLGGGGSCGTGDNQFCATCCEEKSPGGSQAYSDTVELCICGPGAPCEQDCAVYCTGGVIGGCAACLESQAATDCTVTHCNDACQEFNGCYYNCAS